VIVTTQCWRGGGGEGGAGEGGGGGGGGGIHVLGGMGNNEKLSYKKWAKKERGKISMEELRSAGKKKATFGSMNELGGRQKTERKGVRP